MPRLLHTGQVIIDLVMAVDKLPQPGGDVLAQSARFEAGGGFNVMAAAQRNGLPVVYLGRHGTGRFGDLAREAMNARRHPPRHCSAAPSAIPDCALR